MHSLEQIASRADAHQIPRFVRRQQLADRRRAVLALRCGFATQSHLTATFNRLTNLTNVPATGLDLILRAYAPVDAGPRPYEVTDDSYRALTGLRWHGAGFEWESAVLYSEGLGGSAVGAD